VLAVQRAEAEVAQARYSLATAEEEAAVARREWEQIRRGPGGDDAEEPNPLVFREPQLALARANLAAAEAALAQARLNLDRCRLRAPFAGRTRESAVDAGQFVRAGTPVGAIYATDVAEITVSIPDADLAWIPVPRGPDDPRPGAPVTVRAEFAGDRHRWAGRAVRLGGAVDRQSRLVPVVVEVVDPYRSEGDRPPLVEGMFVEVIFAEPAPEGAVAIPRAGLRPGGKAWLVDADGILSIREIRVARAGVEQAVVTGGLNPGDRICISNLQYVTDGMQVRVAGRAAAAPAPADGDTADGRGAVPDGIAATGEVGR
jgi:RND family efflux transporter MFP subunit